MNLYISAIKIAVEPMIQVSKLPMFSWLTFFVDNSYLALASHGSPAFIEFPSLQELDKAMLILVRHCGHAITQQHLRSKFLWRFQWSIIIPK